MCYSVYYAAFTSQITSCFAILGMRPLRAAALPVNAAQSPYRISSRYSLCDGTGRVAAALPVNAAQSPSRISSRYSLCDGTGRVAAALPVSAALIDSPCSQSRRLQRRFFTLCIYVIFSALRRPKLHLRRFRTSQM